VLKRTPGLAGSIQEQERAKSACYFPLNCYIKNEAERAKVRIREIARAFEVAILIPMFEGESPACAQSPNLPLEHWAYDFLERLEAKGLYTSRDFNSKPYSRQEVAEILIQVESKVTQQPHRLTGAEQRLLEQLKGELVDELANPEPRVPIDRRQQEPHLFTWRDENEALLHADAYFSQTLDFRQGSKAIRSTNHSRTTLGGILRGNIKGSLVFYLDARNSLLKGNVPKYERFNPSQGLPLVISGNNVFSDQARAYFVGKLPWFEIQLGRDQARWGPGYRGSLTLSEQADVFDMIKLKVRFKTLKLTYLHGFLNSGLGKKYLAGHRLEVRLRPGLYLGFSETVVYGGRGVEIMYLNPLIPYHIAEHHLGDKDNNTMSFDITANIPRHFRFYAELFIDDYTSLENPFTYAGNKWAALLGGFWIEPLGLKDTDLRLEYTRIEPYVYTHYEPINEYTNYDNILGHWLGPDADDLYLEANRRFSRDLKLGLFLEQGRRGKNDLKHPLSGDVSLRKHFLDGVVERQRLVGVSGQWQIRRDVFLSARYSFVKHRNFERQPGLNGQSHQVAVQFYLNY